MRRKMHLVRWSSIAGAASMLAVSPVLSQDIGLGSYSKPISFGAFAGASIPTGDFADFAGTGWHAGGMLQWNSPTSPFGFRIDGVYHKFGDKDESDTYPNIIMGSANGLWTFAMATSTVRPYLIAGIGIYNGRCTPCNSETRAGVNGGAGINVPLSGFATIIEARWHYVFGGSDIADASSVPHMAFVPVSVGILFR